MTERRELTSILDEFYFAHQLIIDLLESLTDEQLELIISPKVGTVGQQMSHIFRVWRQYLEAIETKNLGPIRNPFPQGLSRSKTDLLAANQTLKTEMATILESLTDKNLQELTINWQYWGEERMDLAHHLRYLIDHFILHTGQLMIYGRILDLTFPASWSAWGL